MKISSIFENLITELVKIVGAPAIQAGIAFVITWLQTNQQNYVTNGLVDVQRLTGDLEAKIDAAISANLHGFLAMFATPIVNTINGLISAYVAEAPSVAAEAFAYVIAQLTALKATL